MLARISYRKLFLEAQLTEKALNEGKGTKCLKLNTLKNDRAMAFFFL